MTTQAQRTAAFSITRMVIFILICITVVTDKPISDICAILSAGAWLWLPSIVAWELKMLDKWSKK